ncbi:hypothetical protein BCV69DRAFT_301357 [Microstroma glucosiphilum]|uniref:SH3 domain-containing protein n=1 Tax=Pseudomicrostroma glucosiphilum TaxID=1684307 RepID=A0A316U138_9BASI|nr:hypothetical protein BCV69DRAFT_301357 [Pseudomicrostroma glucosiphilum]PWN18211.1 hypothetical protein BCV69DRAFT_301357 [Pseudomicrostroma glucosiphilum]
MDFSLLFANKILFVTLVLATIGWLVAFIGQAAAEADNDTPLGRVWFGIFVQLFVILGVAVTLASDSIGMARLQLTAWIVVALVLAVLGIDEGIYSSTSSYEAMAAGYFILTIVNIIWLFFFTSEEGSPIFNLFHSWGGGGQLSGGGGMGFGGGRRNRGATGVRGGPGGMRMGNNSNSANGNGSAFGGGYGSSGAAYQPAYGQSPSTADVTGGNKAQRNGGGSQAGSDMGGAHTAARSASQHRNLTPQHSSAALAAAGGAAGGDGASSPSHYTTNAPSVGAADPLPGYGYKARALYAYSANPDDPTEIGFAKGEILNIVDNSGKWWQAKKDTGETGIVPSNYMQLL